MNSKDYKGLNVEEVYQNTCVVCGGVYLGPKQPHICYECKCYFETQHQKELDLYANKKTIEVLKELIEYSSGGHTLYLVEHIQDMIDTLEANNTFLLK